MIIGIFGLPGAGKTALNTHFLINDYQKNGLSRLRSSSERIEKYAREQKRAFTLPSKAPYYATQKNSFSAQKNCTFIRKVCDLTAIILFFSVCGKGLPHLSRISK